MKKQMASMIAGAAFLAAAGGASAADRGSSESFMDIGAISGEVCTADKNTIQYATEFFVSKGDLQAIGMEARAFAERYEERLSGTMKAIWYAVASGYKLSDLQNDPAKLDEMSGRLNAAQKRAFDMFEADTGITVMTDTSATGTRPGCAPY